MYTFSFAIHNIKTEFSYFRPQKLTHPPVFKILMQVGGFLIINF